MKMTKDKYEGVGYRDNEGDDDMGGKGEVIVRLRVRVMISMRVGLLAKAKERVKGKVVMNIKVRVGCMRGLC